MLHISPFVSSMEMYETNRLKAQPLIKLGSENENLLN